MKALVISGSRADWNCVKPVFDQLIERGHGPRLMAFRPAGMPYEQFPLAAAIYTHRDAWDLMGGLALQATRNMIDDFLPDLAILAGDRFEMAAAALTCSLCSIPIAHLGGGDVTEGSADDGYREAISAMARWHFPNNWTAYYRLQQYRYRAAGIWMVGSPAIDRMMARRPLTRDETFGALGLAHRVADQTVLACVQPNTAGPDPFVEFHAVIEALDRLNTTRDLTVIWLGANEDVGGRTINDAAKAYCASSEMTRAFRANVPSDLYYSLLDHCDVMIGNSSAGFFEAPYFGIPVVNVGDRQKGRTIPGNLRQVSCDPKEIAELVKVMLQTSFRCRPSQPYGEGQSAALIVAQLEEQMGEAVSSS